MKIKIEYESCNDKYLPECLHDEFEKTIKRVIEDRSERDKIRCDIESLKGKIIRWLASNHVKEKNNG